jgi:hypothetical protein
MHKQGENLSIAAPVGCLVATDLVGVEMTVVPLVVMTVQAGVEVPVLPCFQLVL